MTDGAIASTCVFPSLLFGGDAEAIFLLGDNATLSNVILGPNNGEGVHCLGTCTLNNVWWQDVCEDAATFKQKSGDSYVNGGGARNATDKVFQHNGGGTVHIKNFYVSHIAGSDVKTLTRNQGENNGKLWRSCGTCGKYTRHVTIENVYMKNLKTGAGVNENNGGEEKFHTSRIIYLVINPTDCC